MKEILTEEQMLLLDNLMYWEEVTGKHETVGELIRAYKSGEVVLESDALSGGFEKEEGMKQFKEILQKILEDDTLMHLKKGQYINTDVRAACFTKHDETGNVEGHIVAFRGTGGVYDAWKDNLQGAYLQDTPAQEEAAIYIKELGYEDITVTGHSKGGNLAMYTTVVRGDQIQNCVSFDGQGFGHKFFKEYGKDGSNQIASASEKIKSVSAYNDYVNGLLWPIAETNLYFDNVSKNPIDGHSPYWLYQSNVGKLSETGGTFTEEIARDPSEPIKVLLDGLNVLATVLPDDDVKLLADAGGAVLAGGLSRDDTLVQMISDIGKSCGEHYSNSSHIGGSVRLRNQICDIKDRIEMIGNIPTQLIPTIEQVIEIQGVQESEQTSLSDENLFSKKLVLTRDSNGELTWDDNGEKNKKLLLTKDSDGELVWGEQNVKPPVMKEKIAQMCER